MKLKLKRKTAAASLVAVALLLSSCGGEAAGTDERVLRLSHFVEPNHPIEACGMEAMRQELDGSSMRLETYPAAQLGGETQSLELVDSNNLDMSINGPSFLGVYDQRFNVLDTAYLFENREQQREFMVNGDVDPILDSFYEETGMKVFPGWYYGTRHVTGNKEIETQADLRGLKLRTPDAPLYRINMAAMGASPTPMALNELYLGLQQGVVDAQENPLATIQTMNLESVQSDLSLTGHMVQSIHISVSQDTWSSLTEPQRARLSEAIDAGGQAAYDCMVEEEDQAQAEFDAGDDIRVHETDTTELRDQVREELSEGYSFSEEYSRIIQEQL